MGRPSEPVGVIPAKGSGKQKRSRNTSIGITVFFMEVRLKRRMGPIFGGMLLSGEKVAWMIAEQLGRSK